MTAGTERLLGMAFAILGIVALVVAVVAVDGMEAWLLASSGVFLLVCGAGLVMNARSRLRREPGGRHS
jgi:Flp pilus assembly protein TadB